MFLTENSLFTTQAERDALVSDKRAIANLFYLNFVGFLGLVKIDDKKGAMVSYLAKEKKLRPATIDETNNDPSLVIKLALDAGIIRHVAAISATKLLVLIKQKKVNSSNMDEKAIRDILEACRIQTNRPDQRIYNIIQDFIDGKQDLAKSTALLYKVSRLPEYTKMTDEWRDLVTRGGYTASLIKLQTAAAGITQTPAPSPTIAARQIVQGRTKSDSMPPQQAQSGSDADYMHCLLHMFKMRTAGQGYLERFGFKASFDEKRFIEFVQRPDFILPDNPHITSWDKHPFALWVKKRSQAAYDAFVAAAATAKKGGSVPQSVATTTTNTVVAPDAPVARPAPVQAVKVEIVTQQSVKDFVTAQSVFGMNAVMRQYNWDKDTFKKHMPQMIALVKQLDVSIPLAELENTAVRLASFITRRSEFFNAFFAMVFSNWAKTNQPTPLEVKSRIHEVIQILYMYATEYLDMVYMYFKKTFTDVPGNLNKLEIIDRSLVGYHSLMLARASSSTTALNRFFTDAHHKFLAENGWDINKGALFAHLYNLEAFKSSQFVAIVPNLYPANKWYQDGNMIVLDQDITLQLLGLTLNDLKYVKARDVKFETIPDNSIHSVIKKVQKIISDSRWSTLTADNLKELVEGLELIYNTDPNAHVFSDAAGVRLIEPLYLQLERDLPANILLLMVKDIARKRENLTAPMWFVYLPYLMHGES